MKGLKVPSDIDEGLLRVCCLALGSILAVKVFVVIGSPCMLKIKGIDIPVVNFIDHRTHITIVSME